LLHTFETEEFGALQKRLATHAYYITLGVPSAAVGRLKEALAGRRAKGHLFVHNCHKHDMSVLASHKRREADVHVTLPERVGTEPHTYRMFMRLDADAALVKQNSGSNYVNGMFVIEAARQTAVSVVEQFYLSEEERYLSGFLLTRLSVELTKLIFPTGACEVIARVVVPAPNKYDVTVEMWQNGDKKTKALLCAVVLPAGAYEKVYERGVREHDAALLRGLSDGKAGTKAEVAAPTALSLKEYTKVTSPTSRL
jgi:hypothetical protein